MTTQIDFELDEEKKKLGIEATMLAERYHGEIVTPYSSRGKNMLCRCGCGKEFYANLRQLRKRWGCPECSQRSPKVVETKEEKTKDDESIKEEEQILVLEVKPEKPKERLARLKEFEKKLACMSEVEKALRFG